MHDAVKLLSPLQYKLVKGMISRIKTNDSICGTSGR
jgi:hypothetical protein